MLINLSIGSDTFGTYLLVQQVEPIGQVNAQCVSLISIGESEGDVFEAPAGLGIALGCLYEAAFLEQSIALFGQNDITLGGRLSLCEREKWKSSPSDSPSHDGLLR